ncbi:unnamed protein product [Haemonchus placei]|uniref:Uncharacterized protein n=1 Tax=Haemonchus placei TaxID=6290 RepID=A0A0N4WCZ5_HAEPC|nr:unnamed protein product [Haemonchus placei]
MGDCSEFQYLRAGILPVDFVRHACLSEREESIFSPKCAMHSTSNQNSTARAMISGYEIHCPYRYRDTDRPTQKYEDRLGQNLALIFTGDTNTVVASIGIRVMS